MRKSLLKSEFEVLSKAQDDGWVILDLEDYEVAEEGAFEEIRETEPFVSSTQTHELGTHGLVDGGLS